MTMCERTSYIIMLLYLPLTTIIRNAAAIILKVVYGHKMEAGGDSFVELADKTLMGSSAS
jgi:hypothetical protein